MNKNRTFQAEPTTNLYKRLKETNVLAAFSAIKLRSSIIPARIPISFRGLPIYVKELWSRMKSFDNRQFAMLATDANFQIFLKCIMFICEAKVTYAQMKCRTIPNHLLPSLKRFTENQLQVLTRISKKLPYPVVIFVEAIGNFKVDNQPVVPVLTGTEPLAASGAISFSPTEIAETLSHCREPLPVKNVIAVFARELDELPGIDWVQNEMDVHPPTPHRGEAQPAPIRSSISVTPATLLNWNGQVPTPDECQIFNEIIESMDRKKDFNWQCDITTGDGSVVQVVRFPDSFDPDELETLYYMNTDVPTFEEKIAPALMLGYENRGTLFSHFCTSYADCYKHGSASMEKARNAIFNTARNEFIMLQLNCEN